MSWLLSVSRETEKGAVYQFVLLARLRLFFTIGAFSLVGVFSAKADIAAETLARANLAVLGKVAASPTEVNSVDNGAALLATETKVDQGGKNIFHSDESQKPEGELQPPREPKPDMEVLGGIALLIWALRLRSFGS